MSKLDNTNYHLLQLSLHEVRPELSVIAPRKTHGRLVRCPLARHGGVT